MPKITNTFSRGIMNRDSDDRLVQNGEYRLAVNANIGRSESSDVGALENVEGNINVSNLPGFINPKIIGSLRDQNDDRLYWFITSDNRDAIYEYHEQADLIQPIIVEEKQAAQPVFDTFFVAPNEALTSFGGITSQDYKVTKNSLHSHTVTSDDPWVTVTNPTSDTVTVTVQANPLEEHRETVLTFTNLTTGETEKRLVKQLHESAITNYIYISDIDDNGDYYVNDSGGYFVPGGSGSEGGATGSDGEHYEGPQPAETDTSDDQEATSQGQVFLQTNQVEPRIPDDGEFWRVSVEMDTVPNKYFSWEFQITRGGVDVPGITPPSGIIPNGELVVGDYSVTPSIPPPRWDISDAERNLMQELDQITLHLTNNEDPPRDETTFTYPGEGTPRIMVETITLLGDATIPTGTIDIIAGAASNNPHGQTVTLKVNPFLNGVAYTPSSFQWQRRTPLDTGWHPITASAGGTADTYSFINGTQGQDGEYRCQLGSDAISPEVFGGSESVTLSWAEETLPFGATSDYHVGNINTIVGSNVTLRCNVVGQSEAPTYQWQEIVGTTWQNISGETGFDLEFHPAAMADSGTYRCQVTHLGTITNTNDLVLDIRQYAVLIYTLGGSDTVQQGESLTFSVSGTVPLGIDIDGYQWYQDGALIGTQSTVTRTHAQLDHLSKITLTATVAGVPVLSNEIVVSKSSAEAFRAEFEFLQGSAIIDEGTTFEVRAIPLNAQGSVTYAWERLTGNGTWVSSGNLSDNGNGHDTFIIGAATGGELEIRCVMTDGSGAEAIAGPIKIVIQLIVSAVKAVYVGPSEAPEGSIIEYSSVVTGGVPPYTWDVTIEPSVATGFPLQTFPAESAIGNITPMSINTATIAGGLEEGDYVDIRFYVSDSTSGAGAGSFAVYNERVDIIAPTDEALTFFVADGSELVGTAGRNVTLEGEITGGTGQYIVVIFLMATHSGNSIITVNNGDPLEVGDTFSHTIVLGTQSNDEGTYYAYMYPFPGPDMSPQDSTQSVHVPVEFIDQPPVTIEFLQSAGDPNPFEGDSFTLTAVARNVVPGSLRDADLQRAPLGGGSQTSIDLLDEAIDEGHGVVRWNYTVDEARVADSGEYRFRIGYIDSEGQFNGINSENTNIGALDNGLVTIDVQTVAEPPDEGGTGMTGRALWSNETLVYVPGLSSFQADLAIGAVPLQSVISYRSTTPNPISDPNAETGAAIDIVGTWSAFFTFIFGAETVSEYGQFRATFTDGSTLDSAVIEKPPGGPGGTGGDTDDGGLFGPPGDIFL